jgi:long-subunit fatty acid transport protein
MFLSEDFMRQKTVFSIFLIFILFVPLLQAQDVPFLWGNHWPVGARALSLGGAYTGVADDYTALYYNPAGLGQIQSSQFFGTLGHLMSEDQVTFLGKNYTETSSYTKLNSLGLVIPVPTARGSLVFAAGYHNVRQYDNALVFSYFLSTPGDSVTQEHSWLEEGGLHNVALGISVEMAPDIFLGGSLNFWGGKNDYTWQFKELDEPHDIWWFSDTTSTEQIVTEFSGINLNLSVLYRYQDRFRFGGTLVTPLTLKSDEDWSYRDVMNWDDGASTTYEDFGKIVYKVQSPWVFRFGAAVDVGPLMVSGNAELVDYSQIKFKTDPPSGNMTQSGANLEIKQNLENVINYCIGGEIEIPKTGVTLRGGYAVYPSPFKDALSGWDRKVYSLGGGFAASDQFEFNLGVGFTSWDGIVGGDISSEEITMRKILVTFLYRM